VLLYPQASLVDKEMDCGEEENRLGEWCLPKRDNVTERHQRSLDATRKTMCIVFDRYETLVNAFINLILFCSKVQEPYHQ